MKVALIVIGRLENRYAIEFVEYYKQLGIDHIFIGDNNNDNEEHFENVLQSYINDNFVTIINLRNKGFYQYQFYLESYNQYNKEYDWFIFIDFDEFITLVNDNNIKQYLSRPCFDKFNQILINWKVYNDNNLLYNSGDCLTNFTTPINTYQIVYDDLPINAHVKCIVRNNIKDLIVDNVHLMKSKILENTTCNNCGNLVTNLYPWQEINYDLSYIKHFFTKTIDEYIHNRMIKWNGKEFHNNLLNLNVFFNINELTPSKIKYLIKNGYNIDDLIKQLK